MSGFGFRSFVLLVILFVSPMFVSSGFAAHGTSSLSCFNKGSDEHLRIDIFIWCNKQSNPSRCHKISRDANHHYMGRCVAGLPIPPWSKIFGDARLEYLNKIPKRVPQRQKTARSYVPLNSKKTLRSIQSRLSKLGYRPGPIDGKMGRQTRAAIKAYQRRHRLSVTGRPNRQLLAALKITSSARPSRSSRRSSSAGGTKRRTATSSAIDRSFATKCLRADRTNSFYNSCNFKVTEKTITKAPGGGWTVMGHQSIKPGRRGGLLMPEYRGRYYYMGCRTSDIDARSRNKCVQLWFCLQNMYKRRVAMPSAESLLGRCGASLKVTKGR